MSSLYLLFPRDIPDIPEMAAGRPTLLTPEVQAKICNAVSAGNYYQAACAYAGISRQTFLNWMKRGKKARSGQFFEFFGAVRKAQADAEVRVVTLWQQQIPNNWQAARDFLVARFRQRWGKSVVQHEHTGAGGKEILLSFARQDEREPDAPLP